MSERAEPQRVVPSSPDRPAAAAGRAGAEALAGRVLALQRAAGNAAVGRALARDAWSPVITRPAPVPDLSLGPRTQAAYQYRPVPDAVAAQVRAYVERFRVSWGERVRAGSISMPEVVAAIRADVADSLKIEAWQIEPIVADVMGRETPPATRGRPSVAGTTSELEASIANAFANPPKVKLVTAAGTLQLSVTGIDLRTKIAGADVTVQGGPGSVDATVKKGDVTVKGSASSDSLGLKTEVGDVAFEAKLEKNWDRGTWSTWSMELTVPISGEAGDAVPVGDELRSAVLKAHEAVGRIAAHINAGGSPGDDAVKAALADIRPAVEGVSKTVAKPKGPSATLGVKAARDASSGLTVGATLTIVF